MTNSVQDILCIVKAQMEEQLEEFTEYEEELRLSLQKTQAAIQEATDILETCNEALLEGGPDVKH